MMVSGLSRIEYGASVVLDRPFGRFAQTDRTTGRQTPSIESLSSPPEGPGVLGMPPTGFFEGMGVTCA